MVRGIIDCLDTRELPDYARYDIASEAAACLKEIIDRVELPAWEEVPDVADLEAAEEPESAAKWHVPGTRLSIGRVDEGPQKHEYLFTPGNN